MNLTRAFVETMLRALSQWHKDFYDTAAAKRTAKPFYIRNETGMDFTFWITGTQMRWKLDSGSERPRLAHSASATNSKISRPPSRFNSPISMMLPMHLVTAKVCVTCLSTKVLPLIFCRIYQ